jgi:hypothetical protein
MSKRSWTKMAVLTIRKNSEEDEQEEDMKTRENKRRITSRR